MSVEMYPSSMAICRGGEIPTAAISRQWTNWLRTQHKQKRRHRRAAAP
jgi:hypothetical protein